MRFPQKYLHLIVYNSLNYILIKEAIFENCEYMVPQEGPEGKQCFSPDKATLYHVYYILCFSVLSVLVEFVGHERTKLLGIITQSVFNSIKFENS